MATRNYVGARYVPKFATPVEWKENTAYEALTIVTYNLSSYTSKIPVPPTVGNPAENADYWALTGNYNAQVEEYRQETNEVKNDLSAETEAREKADSDIRTDLGNNITAEVEAREKEDSNIRADFKNRITEILKNLTFDTPENHGAVGDGVTDDTAAVQSAINSNMPVLGAKKYKIKTITIPASKEVYINSLVSEATCAVKITSGNYGRILVNKINCTGDCVQFINGKNEIVERTQFFFGALLGNAHAINFLNAGGVLDSTIAGDTWETDEHAFYIADNTEYVGQMNIDCNRIISANGYAIYLDSTNAPLTGFNFNYCSLEATHSGIYIKYQSNVEPIYGNFRIRENMNNGNPMLKLEMGNKGLSDTNLASHIHFDFIFPDQINLDNFILDQYFNLRSPMYIEGDLYTRQEFRILATHVAITPRGLSYVPACRTGIVVSSNVTSFNNINATYLHFSTPGGVTAITLPSYFDGTIPFSLNLANETTVRYYSSPTNYSDITVPAGVHYITIYFDDSGHAIPVAS